MTNKMVHQKKPGVNTREKILMPFNIYLHAKHMVIKIFIAQNFHCNKMFSL